MMPLPVDRSQARACYAQFVRQWRCNLRSHGVRKPPKFGTASCYLYIYAFCHMGEQFKATDAAGFVRNMGVDIDDPQELRHMSNVGGYNARSRHGLMPDGTRVRSGYYALVNLTEPLPEWRAHRHRSVNRGDWTDIKQQYGHRCACCGSLEGQPNHKKPTTVTVLEQGHMDPGLPLGPGNIIPQCQVCNKPYKNTVVFDTQGYVWALGDPTLVLRSRPEIKQRILQALLADPDLKSG